jgi:predicted alpha/beta superfamily hydrolase
MNRTTTFLLLLIVGMIRAYSQSDGDDIVIGKYRKIHSEITNEDRTLLIWLPGSYNQSAISYPVMYILYGQNRELLYNMADKFFSNNLIFN